MRKKNVLILCSDEHARSALGCYGHPLVTTPTLDKLAGLGTRFTRAYTPSPICVPARACLATGTPVHENRCWSSAQPYRGQQESWMHRLRSGGHAVVSVGKLHYRSAEDDNGFSEEIMPMYLANEGKGWPQGLIRDPLPGFDETVEMAREAGQGESTYTEYDRRIAEAAEGWLDRYPRRIRDKPWALFVSFVSPHYPLSAPPEFYDLYARRDLPPTIPARSEHPVITEMASFWDYDAHFDGEARDRGRRGYYGLCSFLDDNCRRVLEALEDSGAARDTLVVYLSDHGEMLGNHGFWGKSVMYEDSVGIPMILSGQGVAKGVNDTPVSLTDIAATVEHEIGLKRPAATEPWQSRPLQSFIETPEPEREILSEYHDGGSPTGFYMIRQGRWKYVCYAGDYPPQLFDLDADPDELHDLGSDPAHERTVETMDRHLAAILDPEEVNAQAFADQAALIEDFGGAEAILAMPGFNHTPVGS